MGIKADDHQHRWEYEGRFRTCQICFKIQIINISHKK